ncbi:MAG: winged helix-turn-helix transcriptional regulator [archaeon]
MTENTKIKLDLKDKKILALLDENSRETNSQIAKKVGLSKPAVEYRIQRLEKSGAIFEYYTIIDFTKLGYSQYKIYFRFQNADLEDEKKIVNYWMKNKNAVWVAQIRGNWDLAVSILAKSNFQFGEILNEFMKSFSKFILQKDILLTEYSPIYARKYMPEAKNKEFVYASPTKITELDEVDEKILGELAINARINIVDLSEKLKITRDVINYRLKKLVENKIIVQYRCYLNLNSVGINHYKLILRTKNLDEKTEQKLKDYLSKHKKATAFLKLIGSWDLEMEFETEDENELYSILNEIRKEFSEIIGDFDILRITETFKYNYFPF